MTQGGSPRPHRELRSSLTFRSLSVPPHPWRAGPGLRGDPARPCPARWGLTPRRSSASWPSQQGGLLPRCACMRSRTVPTLHTTADNTEAE